MKSRFLLMAVTMLTVFSMLLTACGADATPTAAPAPATASTAAGGAALSRIPI
jgi:hypothetical protein